MKEIKLILPLFLLGLMSSCGDKESPIALEGSSLQVTIPSSGAISPTSYPGMTLLIPPTGLSRLVVVKMDGGIMSFNSTEEKTHL